MNNDPELIRYLQFRRFMESGPLVLDCMKERAFMEAECLALSEEQFRSLYLLVQREGEYMAFEILYKSVWEPMDFTDCREAVREGMDKLAEILNAAGSGLVRIEVTPEGYCYRLGGVKKY